MFEDADNWAKAARSKLDKFEENLDKPNFINYDLLETKDPQGGPDIINFGETLVTELEEHKDISMARVASQIKQLGITFNNETIGKLKQVVKTEVIEGVEIDEGELASMEEMMREASTEPSIPNERPLSQSFQGTVNNQPRISLASDSQPITRQSLAALMGEPNDLLSESPVFQSAAGPGSNSKPQVPEVLQSRNSSSTPIPDVEEPLDE